MNDTNCTNCKFALKAQIADDKGQPVIGQFQYTCHRFPPSAFAVPGPAGAFNLATAFPAVTAEMVCEEYRPIDGESLLLSTDVPRDLNS